MKTETVKSDKKDINELTKSEKGKILNVAVDMLSANFAKRKFDKDEKKGKADLNALTEDIADGIIIGKCVGGPQVQIALGTAPGNASLDPQMVLDMLDGDMAKFLSVISVTKGKLADVLDGASIAKCEVPGDPSRSAKAKVLTKKDTLKAGDWRPVIGTTEVAVIHTQFAEFSD